MILLLEGMSKQGIVGLIASSTVCVSHLLLVLIQVEGEMLSLVPEASLGFG